MSAPENPPGFIVRTEAQKAAFDAGKVSFADDGAVLFHPALGEVERSLLLANAAPRLKGLSPNHLANLDRHRKRAGF